ncbi:MAG: hypothetical protein U5J99_11500 [Parvularculaceae bacterium]|nr:hypothetical protein [Parvularculaceae bacterium]
MPFIREAYSDPVFPKGPKLLDQPLFILKPPFALKKRLDLLPAAEKLRAISPGAVRRIDKREA